MHPDHITPDAAELEVLRAGVEDIIAQYADHDMLMEHLQDLLEEAYQARALAEREEVDFVF
jgi:hypothetical protein